MVKKVGFVGLGTMGEPMAANLLRAGYALTVVAHRDRAPVERLVDAGAVEAPSITDMASDVGALITCVPNDASVEQVMLGDGGVIHGSREGLVAVATSTISPRTSQRVAAALEQRGIAMLDAPISGGQPGAVAGTLAIMVGGPRDAYEKVLPVLQAMGKSITHIGGNGSGLVVKLANNLIGAATTVAISEAFTMAAKAGLDLDLVHEILCQATARSWMLERVKSRIMAGNLQPGFKLSLMHKDMGLASDFGQEMGVPMFSTALVHQLYTQAIGLGKGDLDFFAISQLYTEATGASLKARAWD